MSKYEKSALWRFLLIYVASTLLLIIITATLYYQKEIHSLTQMQRLKMAHVASGVASDIIHTHMQKNECCYFLKPNSEFDIALFSEKKEFIDGDAAIKEVPKEEFGQLEGGQLYYVDRGAYNHLEVDYIVIKEKEPEDGSEVLKTIITTVALLIPLLTIFAYFLAHLFLAPVREKIEQLDTFIKNSTHELNTPMTALLLSVNALKKKVDEKAIRRIEASAKTLHQIYEGLSFSTLQNSYEKNDEQIDMKKIVEDSLTFFEQIAQSKKISLSSELHSLQTFMDKRLAAILVNNLIANAIKYNNPNGKVDVILKDSTLCIIDNGIGMKETKDIFKRFFRAKSSVGGFGLGLDIVKQICDEYTIDIHVESKTEVGSKFCLLFAS